MPAALFRVRLASGEVRWAHGQPSTGPVRLLAGFRLASALAAGAAGFDEAFAAARADGDVPPDAVLVAPVDDQEVWAAGVTYSRSREARMAESGNAADVYDLVYDAARPELFFKAPAWRVRGPGEPIGVRADSTWDVPEPELALVVTASGEIAGYSVGDDVSSRSIEGENPLYLPQAKVYDGSCALGPCIVPAGEITPPFDIALTVERDGRVVFAGEVSTAKLHRDPADLASWLVRALALPAGAVLLTGTGIVPPDEVSLADGDVVRVAVSGIGTLANPVTVVGTA